MPHIKWVDPAEATGNTAEFYAAVLFNFLNKTADASGVKGRGRLEMPFNALAASVAPAFRRK